MLGPSKHEHKPHHAALPGAMDITYIAMARGFVYLAVVLDWFSRRVLAWRLSITMEAAFCLETLEDALARYGKPEIFNTDQGSQFTGHAFTTALADNGIAISMDGKGAWRDNVFIERLWRSVKYEEVYLRAYESVSEARASIGRYFDFYNGRRPQRALTATHPIKPTSTRYPSAWRPNLGRGSTYRCGKSVQRTGTTTNLCRSRSSAECREHISSKWLTHFHDRSSWLWRVCWRTVRWPVNVPRGCDYSTTFFVFNSNRECVMTKPAVVLIGADKGGVGKTTVARTLLDYFAQHQVSTRAFDTEMPRGTLKRFFPDVADVVDINHVPDQMRIFDTVTSTDAAVSLIDVRSGLLSTTLRALHNIGFIEAAKKGEITFVVFHILGPSIASLDEIAETADYLRDAKYFMVKNFINNPHYFEWDDATYASYFKKIPDAVVVKIPKLVEMATEQVELASVPFATFIANKKQSGDPASYSFVLRGYVRHWLDNVWAEYDRTGLLDIVGARQAPKVPVGKPRPVMKVAEAT